MPRSKAAFPPQKNKIKRKTEKKLKPIDLKSRKCIITEAQI